MKRRHRQLPFDFPRRLLAMGCASLIFSLGLMSASPALHAWVHQSDPASTAQHEHDTSSPLSSGHECVVVWFAHGVGLAVDTAVVSSQPAVWHEHVVPAIDELRLATPHYWHLPGRAPPASLS